MNTMREGKGVGPYEIMQAFFLAIAGLFALLGDDPPALVTVLPWYGARLLWAWLVIFGAVLTVIGLIWEGKRITAFTIEQVGQIMIACTTTFYFIAIMTSHMSSRTGAAYIAYIVSASIIRSIKLERLKRELVEIQYRIDQGK